MIKRQIGTSDIYITPYTLGCMSLGTDTQHALSIIDQAMEYGINHFDSADLYQFGQNEEIVGKAIKGRRDDFIITTKVGNHFDAKTGKSFWDPSKAYIESAVKQSLQRLQTDYIDLYLLHGGTIDDPIDETIEAFESLKQAGWIRAYGISSIRPNVIQTYLQQSNIDAIMMQYSMLDRRPEELLQMIVEHDVSVLARGPLAKGLLTDSGLQMIENKAKEGYLTYTKEELQSTIKQLDSLQEQPLTHTAMNYVMHHPAIVSAVFGASKSEQLHEILQIVKHPSEMTTSMYDTIQRMTIQSKYTAHR